MQEFGQKYLDLGFSVIPIGRITLDENGNKIISYPIPWKKYQSQKATPEDITTWSNRCSNIGIVTGPISNLLVLDADEYKPTFDKVLFSSLNIPVTPVQKTARGGHQYFFKYPQGLDIRNDVCIGHKGSGMDIRANGGMTIVAPTKTSYGQYEWIVSPEDCDMADVPPNLLNIILSSITNPSNPNSENKPHKPLNTLIGLAEGEGRDNAMTTFLGGLLTSRRPDIWDTEVWPMIEAVNNTYKPPLSKSDLERIYKSITTKELQRRSSQTSPQSATVQVVKKEFTPSISFGELMTQEYPAARFVLDPYFETNAVNMVSAPPNTWKSWFLFLVASSIASGEEVLSFKTEQSSVMIVNEEDTFRAVQDRFKLLDITNKKLPIYFHIAQGLKIDKEFVDGIVKEMKEKGIKTLMLDSLRSMHDAEENDSTQMQEVLDHLKEISRNEITVIFTHHHRKRHPLDKQQSADASRGSSAINAAISGHISLDEEKRENGTFLIIHHMKSKAGPKIEPVEIKIAKTDLTGLMTFEYQGTFKSSDKKIEAAKKIITDNLKEGGWMSVNDFIELHIAGDSVVRTALRDLKKSGIAMTITRSEAKAKGIVVSGDGRANEQLYAWCEGKDNELDTFAEKLRGVDPNDVPL